MKNKQKKCLCFLVSTFYCQKCSFDLNTCSETIKKKHKPTLISTRLEWTKANF